MNLKQNTILITGGTSGIGFEMAKQFLALDNKVIVTGRDSAKLEKAKSLLPKLFTIQSDVSEPTAVQSLFQKISKDFPETNILINNAGVMKTVNMQDNDLNLVELTKEIEINLMGPIRMTKQFMKILKNKNNAAIVNVSSGLAFVPLPIAPVYCSTKAAMHSFSQSLRMQLQNTKVKVFELCPPATHTEMMDAFHEDDMKGISVMKVGEMVKTFMDGFSADKFEIRPGQSNQLKFMSRLAPEFILKQLSRPVARMHSTM